MRLEQSTRPKLSMETISGDQIDALCDQYEQEWQCGKHPSIRTYLNRLEIQNTSRLFQELLQLERELLSKNGSVPTWQSYREQFPEYAAIIETVKFSDELSKPQTQPIQRVLQPQQIIGHFELLAQAGSGAMGEVWQARDTHLQRIVALKIPRSLQLSQEELSRFMREARAVGQLHHAGIAEVYEIGQFGPLPFIVSRFVHGKSLKQSLAEAACPTKKTVELCSKIAAALAYAHEQGIIHRDLKPSNILLDELQEPYLVDFGLAKWSHEQLEMTLDGQMLGTPAYMSPEQRKEIKRRWMRAPTSIRWA